MKNALVLLLSLGIATPCLSASDRIVTDKPSPLKLARSGLAKSGSDRTGVVHFTGTAHLTGRFLVGWELFNNRPSYLRVVFFPDKESTALLPYAAENGPVTELIFSNREQAVSILLDNPETVHRILSKDQLSATGEAAVAIRDYRTDVECDHRWYIAELVSASKKQQIAADVAKIGHFGC
jgi:hypothetical protein